MAKEERPFGKKLGNINHAGQHEDLMEISSENYFITIAKSHPTFVSIAETEKNYCIQFDPTNSLGHGPAIKFRRVIARDPKEKKGPFDTPTNEEMADAKRVIGEAFAATAKLPIMTKWRSKIPILFTKWRLGRLHKEAENAIKVEV